jgi:hypothetical protein
MAWEKHSVARLEVMSGWGESKSFPNAGQT